MNQDLNIRPQIIRLLRRNIGEKYSWHWIIQRFLKYDIESTGGKKKRKGR